MDLVTSTREIAQSIVQIFPNPATDRIQLVIPHEIRASVRLFDSWGRLVFSGVQSTEIDLPADMAGGTYFLELTDLVSGQRIVESIVVLR